MCPLIMYTLKIYNMLHVCNIDLEYVKLYKMSSQNVKDNDYVPSE